MKKYVCINDSRSAASKHFDVWITNGEIYTLYRTTGSLVGKIGYIFKELKNKPVFIQELGGYTTPSYSADRFVELSDGLEANAQEAEKYDIKEA